MVEKSCSNFSSFRQKIEQYYADSSLTITILVRVVGCQNYKLNVRTSSHVVFLLSFFSKIRCL